MARLILYTATQCPRCPVARKLVRDVAKELGMVEGRDFIEKLVDGENLKPGTIAELDGGKIHIVASGKDIKPENTPAAVGGQDLAIEALMHQIASTPAIVIDDALAFAKTPTKEKLIARLKA